MAYSDNFPAQRPVFMADFANGGRIDPRATFSRADTPPTYAAPSAVHYWSNEKHLSSENLWIQSDDLSHADNPINDNVDNLTITGGQTGPTSSITTAVELKPNTNNTPHRFYTNNGAVVSSGQLTFSVYAKASGYKNLHIFINGPDDGATFDLSAASVTNDATYPPATTSITQVGSTGWYRCTLTTNSFSGNVQWQLQVRNDSDDYTYAGDGTSAILVYGGQVNTGANALDYQATTTSIHRQYAPSLKSVATAGQPRFEYDPSTDGQSAGTSLGILVEGQSQNLIAYSSDSTQWSNAYSSLTGSAAVAPDGSLSATAWVPDTSLNGHYTHPSALPTVASGTTYTGSVYVKSAGLTLCQLTWSSAGFGAGYKVNFNLSGAGSVVATAGGASGTISQCGNGWFRLTITAAATSSGSGVMVIGAIDSESSARLPTYSGDGYSGLLIWQLQQETGSFASSAISTSGSAVTRAAESLSVATADIGYTGGPVSVVAEVEGGQGNSPKVFEISDETSNNRIFVDRNSGTSTPSTELRCQVKLNGATTVTMLDDAAGGTKFALRLANDDYGASFGGATPKTDTSGILPVSTTLGIGESNTSGGKWNGHVKRIALYNEALSDTNLQALTS
jgi:hypothetical protein